MGPWTSCRSWWYRPWTSWPTPCWWQSSACPCCCGRQCRPSSRCATRWRSPGGWGWGSEALSMTWPRPSCWPPSTPGLHWHCGPGPHPTGTCRTWLWTSSRPWGPTDWPWSSRFWGSLRPWAGTQWETKPAAFYAPLRTWPPTSWLMPGASSWTHG